MLSKREELVSMPRKDPTIAGILSAIAPGSGYVYAQKTVTGLTSFVVNGLIVWSLSDALKNKQYGLSATIGAFGMGWYLGNIIGSVSAANQYNAAFESKILDDAIRK
jgi:hypothetical protein